RPPKARPEGGVRGCLSDRCVHQRFHVGRCRTRSECSVRSSCQCAWRRSTVGAAALLQAFEDVIESTPWYFETMSSTFVPPKAFWYFVAGESLLEPSQR